MTLHSNPTNAPTTQSGLPSEDASPEHQGIKIFQIQRTFSPPWLAGHPCKPAAPQPLVRALTHFCAEGARENRCALWWQRGQARQGAWVEGRGTIS